MSIQFSDMLSFDDASVRYPLEIIKDYIQVVSDQTQNYVSLNIEEYDGDIYEDSLPILAASLQSVLSLTQGKSVQEKLGDVNKERIKYEVYFGSIILNKYKYRLMFIEHGIGGFPAKVYIAKDIVESINQDMKINMSQVVNNELELKRIIENMLISPFSLQTMQEIINASKRKQIRESSTSESEQS